MTRPARLLDRCSVALSPRERQERLRVLAFTSLFPNNQQPLHGLFVRERLQALAQYCDIEVMAPVPWAPPCRWLGERYYRYSQVARLEQHGHLGVRHPRFFILPKILKLSDGLLMAACCLAGVRRLRRTFTFDLIDAHWAYPDGVAAALLAQCLHLPLVLTVRGDDINVMPRQFWRRQCIRWALRRADRVIALSEELQHGVTTLGAPPARITVIPNGVDAQRFHPVERRAARARLGLPPHDRLVLAVGRLHLSKGYPILVEALARLHEQFPDLGVVIVGAADPEANARPVIQAVAAQYGVGHRVHLVGSQPPATLVDWYGAADVFCLPTSREGSANVLLEAVACGLPCVTTPVGGNADIISSPDVGLLVPPHAQAISEAIAHCLGRTWDRQRIAAHVQARTWTAVAAECYRQFSQLFNSSSRWSEWNRRHT